MEKIIKERCDKFAKEHSEELNECFDCIKEKYRKKYINAKSEREKESIMLDYAIDMIRSMGVVIGYMHNE